MRLSQTLFIAFSLTALAACGGRQEVEPEPVVQAEPPPPAEEPGVEDPDDVHLEGVGAGRAGTLFVISSFVY
ncbi:MAG: hypothetical protein RID81_24745 [Sandaracinaceae bacterium]